MPRGTRGISKRFIANDGLDPRYNAGQYLLFSLQITLLSIFRIVVQRTPWHRRTCLGFIGRSAVVGVRLGVGGRIGDSIVRAVRRHSRLVCVLRGNCTVRRCPIGFCWGRRRDTGCSVRPRRRRRRWSGRCIGIGLSHHGHRRQTQQRSGENDSAHCFLLNKKG